MNKFLSKTIATIAAAVTMLTSMSLSASAIRGPEHYTPGSLSADAEWGGFPTMYWGNHTWTTGFWTTHYWEQKYYLRRRYRVAIGYYHDDWVSNQGQTMSITHTVSRTSSISDTVSSEISASIDGIGAKVGSVFTETNSCTFSSSLSLTYNLSQYREANSVRIACMGYVCEFDTNEFCDSLLERRFSTFAYDTGLGKEYSLVYRW